MKYIVQQPWGLGDILYISPLIEALKQESDEIIWPIKPDFMWIKDYLDFNFIPYHDGLYNNFPEHQPIQTMYTDFIMRERGDLKYIMSSKYEFFGYDPSSWLKLKWKRNFHKENSLVNHLNIDLEKDEYILVNNHCGYPPHAVDYVNPETELKIVNLELIEGYTLLDWGMILENAKEIHTVNTSLLIVLGVLTPNSNIHVYPYIGHSNLDIIQDLLSYFPNWKQYTN